MNGIPSSALIEIERQKLLAVGRIMQAVNCSRQAAAKAVEIEMQYRAHRDGDVFLCDGVFVEPEHVERPT